MFKIGGKLNGNSMKYSEAITLIKEDCQRYGLSCLHNTGEGKYLNICKMMLMNRAFSYLVWLRLSAVRGWLWPLARIVHHCLSTKYRMTIQPQTVIGGGLYFPNCWNIVINPRCVIGKNVTIHEYVNIGSNDGMSSIIGDNAVIHSRVCIVGHVSIGNNAILKTGSVVTRDVESFAVIEGSPARKIGINQ